MANMDNYAALNTPSEAELDGFLSKVTEIESVIKGLNSNDEEKRESYSQKADNIIKRIGTEKKNNDTSCEDDLPTTKFGFSKTSINKEAFKDTTNERPPQPTDGGLSDQRAFMAAMEVDAKKRTEDKKKRKKISDEFKDHGNAEFKQGNYEKALELYDKAFELIRDNLALYTNRAQAKIKLERFKEALTDCDWAIRLNPNCMKAYVQEGHAYLGLKEYEQARESYRGILAINDKKESMVKEYIAEVDRTEAADQAEAKAAELFESGKEEVCGVVDVLKRVANVDQLPLYYSGGFRVLTGLLNNVDAQTLFRTHNGLQLPQEHSILKRCLSANPTSLSREDRDVATAGLEMFTAACKDNETNQQKLHHIPGFPEQLMTILEAKFKGQGRMLRTSCLNLIHEASLSDAGRGAIIAKYDIHRLMSALLPLLLKQTNYAQTAAAVVNNIALEKRVKSLLKDNIEIKILPEFEKLLANNKTSPPIAGLAASSATNLAGDAVIRNKMASRQDLWLTSARLLLNFTENKLFSPLECVCGFLMNISTRVEAAHLSHVPLEVVSACYKVVTSEDVPDLSVSRSLGIISNVIVHNEHGVTFMSDSERLLTVLEYLKCGDSNKEKSALKCLTTLSKSSAEVRQLTADNKGTSMLMNFLKSEDENTVGNAALCLSHLSAVPKVCSKLTKTNIIQSLLVLARDQHKPTVQSNCAILIGKLAKGDARHLERLRDLHGIEILHDCMKHVK